MEKAYKEANVDPLKVNYIEAHGTGTKVVDFNLKNNIKIFSKNFVGRRPSRG